MSILCLELLFRSFNNRREVAAYAGLTPSPFKSGGIDREQGISKSGNPRLRKMMIQLVLSDLRAACRERPQRIGSPATF